MDKTTSIIQNIFSLKGFFSMVDILVIFVICFYVIFAFLLTRQVRLLNKSFSSPLSGVIAQAASAHLVISIVLAFISVLSVL